MKKTTTTRKYTKNSSVLFDPNTVKIEKNIPYRNESKGFELVFDKMNVNDSVLITDQVTPKARVQVNAQMFKYKRKTKKQLSYRTTKEGIRVFRLK